MVISAINSVSFRGNRRINREDRKIVEYNPNHGRHVSSPFYHKLAIPAAALILSMYPSNSVSAQGQFDTEKVTELYKKTQNFEILHSRVLENWGKYAEDEPVPKLTVHFISTDGNEDNIEGIILESSTTKYDKSRRVFLKAKYLKMVEQKAPNGEVVDTKYVCYGDATVFHKTGVRQASNFYVDINKESFNYLAQFISGEVNNKAILNKIVVETKQ